MQKEGLTLTSIDIQNAFNSVPHNVVEHMLNYFGVNHLMQ